MRITADDLTHPDVVKLLEHHVRHMAEHSPEGSSYALDLGALRTPDMSVWTLWDKNKVGGCVAMKILSPKWGEIKSMRTAPGFEGRGIGRALLAHIIKTARTRGYSKLSLETGTTPAFYPALNLYARNGFVLGNPFGNYAPSRFNIFMHLDLGG